MPDDEFSQPSNEVPQNNTSDKSVFDTNFDAGVEADEDTDPKKYIQQLTGKLSQTLNTYNNENGEDSELSKYVGKMIVKQAAKGLDDAGKKELIKTINSTEPNNSSNNEENVEDSDEPIEESYTFEKIDEILNQLLANK